MRCGMVMKDHEYVARCGCAKLAGAVLFSIDVPNIRMILKRALRAELGFIAAGKF